VVPPCDCGQAIVSNKVHQNPAERHYQSIKNCTNRMLDRTGAPANMWLLALKYVFFLLNHMYNTTLQAVPLTCLKGVKCIT
jgi:hypothetical protein